MNGKCFLLDLKYKHNKTTNRKALKMDEIEKLLREIMAEYDCSPLFALWILTKMLEVA